VQKLGDKILTNVEGSIWEAIEKMLKKNGEKIS
jgi:hypothetical protein